MQFIKFFAIIGILVIIVGKSETDDSTKLPGNTATMSKPDNKTPTDVKPSSEGPGALPNPGQNPTPATSEIATYINRRIKDALARNPSRSDGSLARLFNEKRSRLQNAMLTGTPNQDMIDQAEAELQSFEMFANKYHQVDGKLESAISDLETLSSNSLLPLDTRYKALDLKSKLSTASSLNEGQRLLKQYDEFKKNLNNPAATTIRPTILPIPTYDPYKQYFENIIDRLKQHEKVNMPNILEDILKNPSKYKPLYDNLREVAEDVLSDALEDAISDLFDIF